MSGKKIVSVILCVCFLVGVLSGCAKDFDATEYTKAILDVSYKNKTEDYIKLTGASEEAAKKIFTNNLDATMKEFEDLKLPDALLAQYRQLFECIMKNVKYSVHETIEAEDNNYTVDVTVEPVTLFDDTYVEFESKAKEYASQVSNEVTKGAPMPSDEEMQNQIYQIYYELLNAQVEAGLKYADSQTVTMHISKNDKDIYEIKQADMSQLDQKMISKDSLL